ncbi:hypothetical protein ACS0TY_011398 [Phlomoides rotata]
MDLLRQLWKYYEDGKLAEFVKKPPAPRAMAQKRNEDGDDDEKDQDEDLHNKIVTSCGPLVSSEKEAEEDDSKLGKELFLQKATEQKVGKIVLEE